MDSFIYMKLNGREFFETESKGYVTPLSKVYNENINKLTIKFLYEGVIDESKDNK